MYADFFGLRELPFNNTPDPRFFFSTPDHEEALASLVYAIRERKGFVLLTGEVGAGKTLVSRMMLRQFGTHISYANINHAVQNAADLMESVCTEFELPVDTGSSNAVLVRTLQDYLLAQFAHNSPVVLMLDEAQNLPVDAFEQLRMIGNLEADDAKLLQIVIVGQPELQRMFASRELRQLRQRIFRSFHLPALSRSATEGYMRHRLQIAGVDCSDIFTSCAVDAIFNASRGLPRLINTICDNAMLSAYSADQRIIDAPFVKSVVQQTLLDATPESECEPPPPRQPQVKPPSDRNVGYDDIRPNSGVAAVDSSETTRSTSRQATTPRSQRCSHQADRVAASLPDESHTVSIEPSSARPEAPEAPEPPERSQELRRLAARMPGLIAQARSAASALRPLVAEARAVTTRTELTSDTLHQRERSARKLASKTQLLIDELRAVLSDVRGTTHDIATRMQQARHTTDRLVAQTTRSQTLADSLISSVSRRGETEPSASSTHRPLQRASARAEHVLPDGLGVAAGGADAEFTALLGSARQSLSELRTLARAHQVVEPSGSKAHATGAARKTPPSTQRLEQQVEELVSLIADPDSTQEP